MNSLSFKVNFIKPVLIQKKSGNDYKSCPVSMVELDTSNNSDISALRKTALSWGYITYAYDIYTNVVDNYSEQNSKTPKLIYALTKQTSDFEKLDLDEILCLTEFDEISNEKNGFVSSKDNESDFEWNRYVSFKGNDTYRFTSELKKLDDVHCPICGVKMLTKNQLEKIIDEGSKIKDPKQFADWIELHDENISKSLKKFSKSANRTSRISTVKNMKDMLEFMHEEAFLSSRNALQNMQKIITEKQAEEQFSDSDNVLLDECKIRLGSFNNENIDDPSNFVKNILNDTIANLESKDKQSLYFVLKNEIGLHALYQKIFSTGKKSGEQTVEQKQILKNLFGYSSANVHKIITNFDEDKDFSSNLIISCSGCKTPANTHLFKYHQRRFDVKKNFETYLEDISKNILNGKLNDNNRYPMGLNALVKSLTGGNVYINKFKTPALNTLRIKYFEAKHDKTDFEPVNHTGVPCSSCGHITITHNQKIAYFKQIEDTKNLAELSQFLIDNKNLFLTKNKPLIFIFNKALEKNPSILDYQMLDILRSAAAKDINIRLQKNIEIASNLDYKLSDENLVFVQKYIEGVKQNFLDFTYKKPFPYQDYKKLLEETLYNIKDDEFNIKYTNSFKESVRKKYNTQTNLFPQKATVEKVGSAIKVVVQNMLKDSAATKDHLQATNNNGSDSVANLSVMCRNCNCEKSDYSLLHWLNLHPQIASNMQLYINKIVQMIKSGELKNMESYPPLFAKSVNILSKGKIILRFDLKNDKKS